MRARAQFRLASLWMASNLTSDVTCAEAVEEGEAAAMADVKERAEAVVIAAAKGAAASEVPPRTP